MHAVPSSLARWTATALLGLGLGLATTAAQAQAAVTDLDALGLQIDWAELTRNDIAAVDAWVRGAYAGSVDPEHADFLPQWQAAVALARTRADAVDASSAWRATLEALVNAARDGHVIFRATAPIAHREWAGIALERLGERFVARRARNEIPGIELRIPDGAELLSCDGRPAAEALERRLDLFTTDWSILANRSIYASHFFLDYANPLAPRPGRCAFRHDGEEIEIELQWTAVTREQLGEALQPFRRLRMEGNAVGLSYADDGSAWLRIGNLADYAALQSLREQVERERKRVLAAPYIVWDLRGNGGGDSSLADAVAHALWGEAARVPGPDSGQPKRWRASPLALQAVRTAHARESAGQNPNPGLVRMAEGLMPAMEAALREGADLMPDPGYSPSSSEVESTRKPRKPRRLPGKGPVYVLTDGGCFSSCIMAVYSLKRLGAVQVGDPTGRHTIYGEVWFQQDLPSGQGRLILPIAIHAFPRSELGGDPPDLPWNGAGEDEAGLRAMIAADARKRRR
jgi:hypothetical protein